MRVLFLIHGFNALSQRLLVEVEAMGHEVSIEYDINDSNTISAIDLFNPDVILAPYLKRAIPQIIWAKYLCLIVHPGPVGDRGPSAIDWAILNNEKNWGVTVLQAEKQMDAGAVWDTQVFAMPKATKSGIYRNEVTKAAVTAVRNCFDILAKTGAKAKKAGDQGDDQSGGAVGHFQPATKQSDRKICWQNDNTETILKKIRSADGVPGLCDEMFDEEMFLYDARIADGLSGRAGDVIAISGPAICRATSDGALWIGHLRNRNGPHPFKLPAISVLGEKIDGLPQIPVDTANGYREIDYHEDGETGHIRFNFYNGAMSTRQCQRLLQVYKKALQQNTKTIILHGGNDFWSNGMHLNVIEASPSPADESWRNINAIDDLAEAIIRSQSHITIAAMHGNAGAGGVFLARACDYVWVREDVILNPHYKDMGNLYGSEFWTYLLPRYAGEQNAKNISEQRLPMGAGQAVDLGLADACFGDSHSTFDQQLRQKAKQLSDQRVFDQIIQTKRQQRAADEQQKPLVEYRREELQQMKQNFFGFDPSYHVARYNFVHKVAKSRTPITLARHRDQRVRSCGRKVS